MRGVLATPLDYAHDARTRQRWIEGLAQLIGFPTVSAWRSYRPHLEQCAAWLAQYLQELGMHRARVLPGVSGGAPSVYADWLGAPAQPTILLYGHYDVQPAEPLSGWTTPPFRAVVRDGRIYGRGASDDKGQFFAHVCAVESYLATSGRLPVNLKIWLEGEEEVNSPTLERTVDRYGDALRANAGVVSDTEIAGSQPSIVYGLRGALPFELHVSTARRELHSGNFGGAVLEPIQQLCRFVATMHDWSGRIRIPGFMEGVREVPWGERVALRRDRHDDEAIREAGAIAVHEQGGYTASELARIRPAITLHSIAGGSLGQTRKTSVPTDARLLGSARLVPEQDPHHVATSLAAFTRRVFAKGVRWRLRIGRGCRAVRLPTSGRVFRAACYAVRDVWGSPPRFLISGGTIQAVEVLHRRLRLPVLVLGFGKGEDRIHATDEHFELAMFFKGVDTMLRLFAELAR
jgi:acetylornithine deacetylase/succinyl-diaminopimelate desuccinylase-like protein